MIIIKFNQYFYRPQTFPLPWKNCREYLQLPTHSNPFYWQYNELSECVDADEVTHISVGGKTSGATLEAHQPNT